MQRPQITEGEWKRDKRASMRIVGDNDRQVATCGGRSSNITPEETEAENEANTRFLAASKQMAEALGRFVQTCETGSPIEFLTLIAASYQECKSALLAAGYTFND